MDRQFGLYMLVGLTIFMLARRYNWMRGGRKSGKRESTPETPKQRETMDAGLNVFDKGVLSAKQELLNTFYYGVTVEPPKTKVCAGFDESQCSKYGDACVWMRGNTCQTKSLTQWSGWTVHQMAPTTAFGGQFIEVEQIDGEGAPVLWKPGMRVRWAGQDPLGRAGIDGDYVIEKVEQIGEQRRLWLQTKNPLNYYWAKPELEVVAM